MESDLDEYELDDYETDEYEPSMHVAMHPHRVPAV